MLGKFGGGDGSSNNPYLVEDALDLLKIGEVYANNGFKLVNDIDLSSIDNWKGIPLKETNIDGNGHIVKNLKSNESSLFRDCNSHNNLIENLGVININIIINDYVYGIGGIASHLFTDNIKITIRNCFTSGTVKISETGKCCYCGGIIGYISEISDYTKIENCHSNINFIDCSTKSNGFQGGGIIGYVSQKRRKKYDPDSYTPVKNCYFNGTISFIKQNQPYNNRVIIGHNNTRYIYCENSFFNSDLIDIKKLNPDDDGICRDDVNCGDIPKTTQEMKTTSTYDSWKEEMVNDKTPVWILEDNKYPKLWFEKEPLKFIIKKDNKCFTINENKLKDVTNIFEPTEKFFIENGIINLDFDLIDMKNNENISLLVFNENMQKINGLAKLYLAEPFLPKDKLKEIDDGKFDVVCKEVEED